MFFARKEVFMKRIFKIIVICIILIILLIFGNAIRNIYIINKLKNNANEYFFDMDSYKLIIKSKYSTINPETNKSVIGDCIQEIYSKDNKTIVKEFYYCEGLEPEERQKIEEDTFKKIMKVDFAFEALSVREKFIFYFFNIIKLNDQSYIIKYNQDVTAYFNKETGMLEKYNSYTYHIEKNTVTDKDMEYTETN